LVDDIAEWTNQTITGNGNITPAVADWIEYYEVDDYKGYNIAPAYYLDSANGIGKIKTGQAGGGLRGFVRGQGGIYSLDLSNPPTTAASTIGFRCAK